MFAVLVNALAIVAAVIVGLLFRRLISVTTSDAVLRMLGICTLVIGFQYALESKNILLVIISVCVGTAIGEMLKLEDRTNSYTEKLTRRFTGKEGGAAAFTSAFITSCLIMNVGAMVIVGSLQAGLVSDYTMLYTKSLLDFVSGIMLAASMGAGVLGSAVFTLIFQGLIVLFSKQIAPFMTKDLLDLISQTGAVLIIAIGFNMLNLTKLRIINALPSLIIAPLALFCTAL